MSTYLKTAAMSLLSKTLQTFLTKYLSDVDVEGVTLPSYDGSGWGVRLSNVQLREGVQLMEKMPGTVKRKRMVKRKQKLKRKVTRTKIKPSTTKDEPNSNESIESFTKQPMLIPLNDEELQEPNDNDNVGPRRTKGGGGNEGERKLPRTNSLVSSEDLEMDYYTDEEIDTNGNPKPTTPAQRSSSVFACFYSRTSKGGNDSKIPDDSLHPSKESAEDKSSGEDSKYPSKTAKLPYLPDQGVTATKSNNRDVLGKRISQKDSEEEEEKDYEYYEVEEEYEEEYELPLRLCLGEGGRIGMVDVRLIGKELHVMVEDAMVTIEAIPTILEEDSAEMGGTDEGTEHGTGGEGQPRENDRESNVKLGKSIDSDDANPSSSEKGNDAAKPKAEPKRDTVYDRVIADNGLAKLISSIPHVFLRDVRVRLVIRNEPMEQKPEGDEGNNASNTTTTGNNSDGYTKPRSSSKDTMVEVGIDFLSVTSGEDVLSHFQQSYASMEEDLNTSSNGYLDATNHSKRSVSTTDSLSSKPPSLLRIPSNVVDTNGEQKNEYLVRHIRTGRGPSAGIFVQLFTPNSSVSKLVTKNSLSSGVLWARQHWISSTEHYLVRCSGLDIQARIHMGTKRVDAGYSWFYGEYVDDQDDHTDIDSLILFGGGMDTIAPGPQLPLLPVDPSPPPEPRMSRGTTPINSNQRSAFDDQIDATRQGIEMSQQSSSMHPGVDTFNVDSNGIQSCNIPSLFHRVSRGMDLRSCKNCKHLPSEVCDLCWEAPVNSDAKSDSPLDSSMPMPGLALQISIRDPLEINIDRNNIESIGLIKSLFTKPPSPEAVENSDANMKTEKTRTTTEITTVPSRSEDTTQTQTTSASTGFFSGLLYGKPEETIPEEEIATDSFEPYMQPESISVMGIYLAETTIRVHVMREDREDRHLSFCYWQIDMNCITLDRQSLEAPEKTFSDLGLDVGRIVLDEYRGTRRKNLASLGVFQGFANRYRSESTTSLASLIDDHARNKKPWPSTSCALMDIPPPLESLAYKSREGHGLQFRFISIPSSTEEPDKASKSLIHLRLGLTTVDSSWDIRNDVSLVIDEIMKNIVGPSKEASNRIESKPSGSGSQSDDDDEIDSKARKAKDKQPIPKFLMAYTIQVDSGNVSLPPMIQVKVPMTRLSGERSSLAGFSIESVLGKLDFSYGEKEPVVKKDCLSLPQIAALPEHARMHILLCLQDIGPLEKALNAKKEKNSFRRIKSVDKAIQKMAKKITKRTSRILSKKKSSSLSRGTLLLDSANRRQNILSEIMKLDDDELTNLWSVHQRYQKKLAQKLREE